MNLKCCVVWEVWNTRFQLSVFNNHSAIMVVGLRCGELSELLTPEIHLDPFERHYCDSLM